MCFFNYYYYYMVSHCFSNDLIDLLLKTIEHIWCQTTFKVQHNFKITHQLHSIPDPYLCCYQTFLSQWLCSSRSLGDASWIWLENHWDAFALFPHIFAWHSQSRRGSKLRSFAVRLQNWTSIWLLESRCKWCPQRKVHFPELVQWQCSPTPEW